MAEIKTYVNTIITIPLTGVRLAIIIENMNYNFSCRKETDSYSHVITLEWRGLTLFLERDHNNDRRRENHKRARVNTPNTDM